MSVPSKPRVTALDGEMPRSMPAIAVVAALALLPYPLKNLLLIGEPSYSVWLGLDYAARGVSLAGVWLAYRWGVLKPLEDGAGPIKATAILVVLLACLFGFEIAAVPVLEVWIPSYQLVRIAGTPEPLVRSFDLWIGLLLVAISEELAFRRLLFALLCRSSLNELTAVLASAAAFGAIHFLGGPVQMLSAFVDGLFFGLAFAWTRRLWICVTAHYALNLFIWSA